jgi:hypothetical protein
LNRDGRFRSKGRKTVNLVSKSKQRGAALVVGFALAGTLAAGAAASGAPQGMGTQAYQALHTRSEALNQAYGLGGGTVGSATRALAVRSQALNQAYGIGVVSPGDIAAALNALEVRSAAMDAQFRLGPYAIVRPTGFDWGDAGIGAAGMLGFVLVAGGLLAGRRRLRELRGPSVPRTT